MKQLQLFFIIYLSIITINCKKTTEPLTLSDRAGTYTFENKSYTINHYVVVNKDGTGSFTGNSQIPITTTIGNPSSTDTVFTFEIVGFDYTIDFQNGTLTETNPYGVWTLVR